MTRRWLAALLILTAVMAASGCRDPGVSGDPSTTHLIAGPSGLWPAYIPDAIPVLGTNIRNVMEGQTHIRIFYSGLSREQIDDYLRTLEENGFRLDYIVYYDERYPDDPEIERRIADGDYDAVDITKGEYRMTLGYIPGDTTLDIYTSGFEETYPYSPDTEWPAELTGVVPQPEECRIDAVYARESGPYSHQIVCTVEDDGAVAAYTQALQAAGFVAMEASSLPAVDPVSASQGIYGKDGMAITVDHPSSTTTMRITVWRAP